MEQLLTQISSYGAAIFWEALGMALDYWPLTSIILLVLLLITMRIVLREFLYSLKRPV